MRRIFLLSVLFPVLLMISLFRSGTGYAFSEQEALDSAVSAIGSKVWSEPELTAHIESRGFSHEEAVYAAANCGADWNEMASARARSYLDNMVFSEKALTEQLLNDGFTEEQAAYAAGNSGIDWDHLALQQARSHLSISYRTTDELIRLLILDGFTPEQAAYAAEKVLEIRQDPVSAELSGEPGIVGDAMINVLTNRLLLLFPIQSLTDSFPSYMAPVYSDLGPGTVLQTRNRDGVRQMKLLVDPGYETDLSSPVHVNSGSLQNFMFSMNITVDDVFPADGGGCFIAYGNELMHNVPEEEKYTLALLANEKGIEFYRKGKNEAAGTHTRISEEIKHSYKLTLIRLTGLTFAFVDDKFAGQIVDDNTGPFHLFYGNAVFSGGDNAYCGFDDLAVRKVTN